MPFEVDGSSSVLEWMLFLAIEYKDLFVDGMITTLYLSIGGTVLGYVMGFLAGIIGDLSINKEDFIIKRILLRVLKIVVTCYVKVFRGTPMIVQAMIIYYGIRQSGIEIAAITAGILVIVLNTGSYMAETVRGGIKAIDVGQREGAIAMGMSPFATMINVILPQAFNNIIPEMCNIFLTNLKMTSVLNVIGISELFLMAKTSAGTYYKYFEAYLVIAVIYLILSFIFDKIIQVIEKKTSEQKAYSLAVEYMAEAA